MEPLTIKTPADVLSFIGHTLGFWPRESLVCITVADNHPRYVGVGEADERERTCLVCDDSHLDGIGGGVSGLRHEVLLCERRATARYGRSRVLGQEMVRCDGTFIHRKTSAILANRLSPPR